MESIFFFFEKEEWNRLVTKRGSSEAVNIILSYGSTMLFDINFNSHQYNSRKFINKGFKKKKKKFINKIFFFF